MDISVPRPQYDDTRYYNSTNPGYPPHRPGDQMKLEYLDSRTPSPTEMSGIDCGFPPTTDVEYGEIEKTLTKLSKKSEALLNLEVIEKPAHSFTALIAMAIQSCPEQKLHVSDIYQYIMENFPYYGKEEYAWKNSIRYTLSINGCFMKTTCSYKGKYKGNGTYWAVHPTVADDFAKGDYSKHQCTRGTRRRDRKAKTSNGDMSPRKSDNAKTNSASSCYHPYRKLAKYQKSYSLGVPVTGLQKTSYVTKETSSRYIPTYSETTSPGYRTTGYTINGTTSLPWFTPMGSTSPEYTTTGTTSMPGFTPVGTSSPGYTTTGSTSPEYTTTGTTSLPGFTPVGTSSAGYTTTGSTSPEYSTTGTTLLPGFTPVGTSSPGYTTNGTTSPGYTPPDCGDTNPSRMKLPVIVSVP